MGISTDLYMYDMVTKKCTFTISSPDEFLFHIVDSCLSCKDIARHSCAMVPR